MPYKSIKVSYIIISLPDRSRSLFVSSRDDAKSLPKI